ncbi:hypothetical protein E3P99_01036 [Wallemia hederae]|uniref:RNA polymerase II subunit A C-terminal domain phosphatase n=1 Tax=Wallemia hederae TaxID=1540922 RepID=A0A4V4LTU6_9BASI|nr:hypothetical protein E3P99_01036 [Wallemia hederae]
MDESCTHPVQLAGLCAICGKDLSAECQRPSYHISHSTANLTVSYDEAERLGTRTKHALLKSSKLSLIVDLDQTVIHATVDPTVNNWLEDPSLVYEGAMEGVHKFKLGDFGAVDHHEFGSWYFVKFRPGLMDFLEDMNRIYEMHVYTMGTKSYASAICQLIDPDGKYFSDRILSRDDSGSFTSKSLLRLFPTDTSMCVIIDDRSDVWDDCPNLVKCIPFEFFVGIGDINASAVLHKKEEEKEDSNESLSKQADQRPLAKRQEEHRQLVSRAPDGELQRLSKLLKHIHSTYYNYKNAGDNPDIKEIIPNMKKKVLQGVDMLFSSVIPLGVPLEVSSIYKMAVSFGALVHKTYSEQISHLVTAKKGTAKVEEAKKADVSHIVRPEWLFDSCAKWERLPEEEYYMEPPPSRPKRIVREDDGAKVDDVDWDAADQELEDFLNEESEDEGDSKSSNSKKRARESSSPVSAADDALQKRYKGEESDKESDDYEDFANELDGMI